MAGLGFGINTAVHGTTGTHNPFGGAAAAGITIILSKTGEDVERDDDMERTVEYAELQVDPDDLTAVDLRDTWTVDSKTWAVTRIVQRAPILVCEVKSESVRRYGGRNYRTRR